MKDASDPEGAIAALRRARDDVVNLDAGWDSAPGLRRRDRNTPKSVTRVFRAPTGPFFWVDGGEVPEDVLVGIVDIVARHLEAAGVTDALIVSPSELGPIARSHWFETVPRAVVLRLYPAPPSYHVRGARAELPSEWLEAACVWLQGDLPATAAAMAAIESMEFPLAVGDSKGLLEEGQRSRAIVTMVVVGDLEVRVRAVGTAMTLEPVLVLGVGGPHVSDAELVGATDALASVARTLDGVSYACISIDHTFSWFKQPDPPVVRHGSVWQRDSRFVNQWAFDAFPWQMLGPGHLARLGAPPPGSRTLPGGRVEVAIGDPADWLIVEPPTSRPAPEWPNNPFKVEPVPAVRRDPDVQERARRLLGPCLFPPNDEDYRRWVAAQTTTATESGPRGRDEETTEERK